MKAIVCNSFGPPSTLELLEVSDPKPKEHEVVIKIKACSVNFPDTLIIEGKYQFKPPFPFSPGSDVSGVIEAVGEKVTNYKVGDEVFAICMVGGYAEKVAVPAKLVFPKPPGMSHIHAASFMLVYSTSYHGLFTRGKLKEGETILVLGAAGGVGLTAVELAKLKGARVIAAASTDDKLELCREYGADYTINYSQESLKDKIKEITNNEGLDLVYDPIGGELSEIALRRMKWNGRYLVVGFATGDIPRIPLNIPLLKSCQIVGVFWGAYAQQFPGKNAGDTLQLIQWYMEGKLKPAIYKTYSLAEAPLALEDISSRKVKGKAVIVME